MPKHVKNPLVSSIHRNSQISFYNALGDIFDSGSIYVIILKISLMLGISFSILCIYSWVPSYDFKHSISRNFIGKRPH